MRRLKTKICVIYTSDYEMTVIPQDYSIIQLDTINEGINSEEHSDIMLKVKFRSSKDSSKHILSCLSVRSLTTLLTHGFSLHHYEVNSGHQSNQTIQTVLLIPSSFLGSTNKNNNNNTRFKDITQETEELHHILSHTAYLEAVIKKWIQAAASNLNTDSESSASLHLKYQGKLLLCLCGLRKIFLLKFILLLPPILLLNFSVLVHLNYLLYRVKYMFVKMFKNCTLFLFQTIFHVTQVLLDNIAQYMHTPYI